MFIIYSKTVGCTVALDTYFAQFRNRVYRMANKVTVGVSHFISAVIYVGVGQANCHSLIQQ